ncbi:ricin-type beta-trefoil lectin protein [Krasilnikovia cinnamomea]|uniref:Ricin-type beta-trefoil lectin protein n=1 Tax=Krasilnikovia cinnamomea TaxID=349313 RepID=A0A4Q7ZEK1_9ACTN|nr:ricin-type beta-trefoil lectin domain protein [Krasilnikovia cinnamomea]RZU49150.1 ricin-type beta-trefoil lectin protein [Krasilnikovia cinnamomea]
MRLPSRTLRRPDADRGSLPIAMLLTLVGLAMSALLVPAVVQQVRGTQGASERTRALHAAEAGLDAAMGQIRAAVDGTGAGDAARLPTGQLDGNAAPDGGQRYRVTFAYRDLDGNPLGPVITEQPGSAVLTSTGVAGPDGAFDARTAGARTLRATYSFRTSNEHIPGGQIHVRSARADLCVDAGSADPAPGTAVTMQACVDAPQPPSQLFAYNPDLTITLVSSRTSANPAGMCLDAGTPHSAGATVRVERCAGTSPAAARQQWSANDVANFMGTSDGTSLDNFCFNVLQPDTVGSTVVLGTGGNCWGDYDNKQTFQPDPAVGAGAAGAATGQLVNYEQFGRCLDVTEKNTGAGYLIAWPCKQAPNPNNVGWNQRWKLPAVGGTSNTGTGPITVTVGGREYCLKSPGSTNAYPTVTACPSGTLPAELTWTVYGDTGTYATSYQIVDGAHPTTAGLCLAAADLKATPPQLYDPARYKGPPIARIVLRTCDGKAAQKWNAPADLSLPTPLRDVHERTG